MKKNKISGLLLLLLAMATIIGIFMNNDAYWLMYNYATIILSTLIGISLLMQK